MKYIYIGKIVNTHGLKGEIKILSDFKYKNQVFKNKFNIYIGKEKYKEIINTYRFHKIFDMITIYGIDNINDVLKYKGMNVYVDRNDLDIPEYEYLDADIINLDVIINNKVIGKVSSIKGNNMSRLLVIKCPDKERLLPYNKNLIESIDLSNNTITYKDNEVIKEWLLTY